jgi:HlyD family secretion protein
MNTRTILVISLAVMSGAGCVNRAAQEQAKKTQAIVTDPKKTVKVAPATTKTLSETLEITGEVTTSSDTQVGAKVPGKVIAVYVKDGDFVSSGQLLAELDGTNQRIQVQQALAQVQAARSALAQAQSNAAVGPQRTSAAVAQAQAQLRSAQAQLQKAIKGSRPEERAQSAAALQAARSNTETAKKELDRVRALFTQQVASQQRLEQAENAFNAAASQLQQAEAAFALQQNITRPEDIASAREAVRQAEEGLRTAQAGKKLDILLDQQVQGGKANLQSAEAQLSLARQGIADLQIRAPMSGQVYGKPVQPGSVLGAGTPAVRLVSSDGAYFEGEFPASILSKIKIGSAVNVSIDGYEGAPIIGSIVSVSPSASNVGRLFRARVMIPFRTEIKPGMFARGNVTLRTVDNATVVPTEAISRRGSKSVVFIVEGDKAKMVEIVPGLTSNGDTQAGGIQPGASIVVAGQADLDDGSTITVEKGS